MWVRFLKKEGDRRPTLDVQNKEQENEEMTCPGHSNLSTADASSKLSVLPLEMSKRLESGNFCFLDGGGFSGFFVDLKRDKIDVHGDIYHLIRNHLIADNIFNFLSTHELKNCRLVSNLWNEKIPDFLRKSRPDMSVIKLLDQDDFDEFQNAMKNATDKRIFSQFTAHPEGFLSLGQEFFEQHQPKLIEIKPVYIPYCADEPIKIDDILTILKWSSGSIKEFILQDIEVQHQNILIFTNRNENEDLLDFDLPHLEKINIGSWKTVQADSMTCRFFSQIVKKSPNLNSLDLYGVHCINFIKTLKRNELSKLKKLKLIYEDHEEAQMMLVDLIKLQENGLENLKYFYLVFNFQTRYYIEEDKVGQGFDLISRFIKGQSVQLESLKLEISVEIKNRFKIYFPILPKLRQLYLEIKSYCWDSENFPFGLIDLSCQLPVLHEISLDTCEFYDQMDISSWNSIFSGSSETVKIFRLTAPQYFPDDISKYFLPLEKFFPNVKKFEVDYVSKFINCGWKKPWENTLEVFSIFLSPEEFEDLDFNVFLLFNSLQRIETYNACYELRTNEPVKYFNIESFENLRIKSFKMHHFRISEDIVKRIRAKCLFDFTPE